MKILKKIALALLACFIALQFYRPEKNTSKGDHTATFINETNPSSDLKSIFENSCYNCHSNNTIYPWYNNIAPISYWMANHIESGKGHLNFSEWDAYNRNEKILKLEELVDEVSKGEMPLAPYTWTHEDAKLTKIQVDALVEWAERTKVLFELGKQPN